MSEDISQLLSGYVKELKKKGAIKSEALRRAFGKVERHRLVEQFIDYSKKEMVKFKPCNPEHLKFIYSDNVLVTRLKDGIRPTSSSSQPSLVAQMLELLELEPQMNLLEIGAGTGYNAALMSEIVGNQNLITTIDVQRDVVNQTKRLLSNLGYSNISVLHGDGFFGYAKYAPYNRIIATVCCADLSPHWVEQLLPKGLMLIPLQHGTTANAPLTLIWQENNHLRARIVGKSGFMLIQGELSEEYWTSDVALIRELEGAFKRDRQGKWVPKKGWTHEYPPFDLSHQDEWWEGAGEFLYFLALHDRRTFFVQGPGLWDRSGSLVYADESKTGLLGNESLYQELKVIYDKWERLGSPRMDEYELEFFPLSEEQKRETRKSNDRTWTIDRKFFQQVVHLSKT